jgi:hypothetical protein
MSSSPSGTLRATAILIAALLVGVGTGGGYAWYLTHGFERLPSYFYHYGPSWVRQKEEALATSQLLLAHAAIFGTFGLPPRETIYITAIRDSDGATLRSDARYQICGRPPEAKYWSVTAYNDKGQFFETPSKRSSFDNENTTLRPDGSYCLTVQSEPASENWLPTNGHTDMQFLFRLYRPTKATRAAIPQLVPTIRRQP